jgi:NitT/TauT family transport system substrate-binding protein
MGNRARFTPSAVASLVLVAAALVAGCGGSSDGESSKAGGAKEAKLSIALGASTLLYSPVYIADIKGYFKEQGLQVKQSQVVASASMQALTGGSVQMAFIASQSYLLAKAKGIKGVAIQANNTGDVNGFLVASNKFMAEHHLSADSPLPQRLAALKGAKIGYTQAGAITEIHAKWILQQGGLKPDDAKLIQVGGGDATNAALKRGAIDMAFFTPPDVQVLTSEKVGQVLIDGMKEFPLLATQPYSVVVASPDWIKQNPDVTRRFTAALAKAIDYIRETPDAAAKDLQSKFPDVQENLLAEGLTAMAPTFSKGGLMTEPMWQNAISLGTQAKTLTGALNAGEGEIWTNEYNGHATS